MSELYLGRNGERKITLSFVQVDVDDAGDVAVWRAESEGETIYVETPADPTDGELVEAVMAALREED